MSFMTLLAKLALDSKDFEDGLGKAKSSASELAGKVGHGLATAAKIGAAAVTAASGVVTALAKNAVEGFAEYEQLVGGVETLFKDSAGTVQAYAEDAYKSAGLSSNEYMETVTSFSASLLQSLGGDTEAAAEYADRAIRDMSDNANKMGSDMSSIQTAYQGFAKQNYTMLDNLKLGYGGTKSEMERLIEDAEKLDKSFSASRDENGALAMSYADIVDAIHIVQDNMGITGTTAKEASETISGSVASMKSAWQNLVTAFGNKDADLGSLIEKVVDSANTALNNIIPVATQAISGIAKGIEKAAPVLAKKIPEIITNVLPGIIRAGSSLVSALGKSLIENLPELADSALEIGSYLMDQLVTGAPKAFSKVTEIIKKLGDRLTDSSSLALLKNSAIALVLHLGESITKNLPNLIQTGGQILQTLAAAITQSIPILLPAVTNTIVQIAMMMTDPEMLNQMLDTALTLIQSLANGLIDALPTLAKAVPEVIGNLAKTLTEPNRIMEIIEVSLELILALADGLIDAIPQLIRRAPEIIDNLVEVLMKLAPHLLEVGLELIVKLTEGIIKSLGELLAAAPQIIVTLVKGIVDHFHEVLKVGKDIVDKVKEGFWAKVEEAKDWGRDLLDNFISGITEKWENLKGAVASVGTTIKNFIGFSEPKMGPLSNFHTFAPDMMDLFIKGIKDNTGRLQDTVADAFDFQPTITGSYGLSTNAKRGSGFSVGGMTVNVYGSDGMSVRELAEEVERRIVFGMRTLSATYA